jgi:hypothetical protein
MGMPLLPDFWEKVKNCTARVIGFFKNLAAKLPRPGFLREYAQKLLGKIPEEKQRLVLICGAGCLALLVFATILLANSGKEQKPAQTGVSRRSTIAPEEIFLPDEPDFITGVLLERERRASWTAADGSVYWQDPMKNGEEFWRERIEKAIDEFMENVP